MLGDVIADPADRRKDKRRRRRSCQDSILLRNFAIVYDEPAVSADLLRWLPKLIIGSFEVGDSGNARLP
jgi:hypothetical protein